MNATAVSAESTFGDGAELLEGLTRFLRRFVVLSQAQADAIALWIVHTHCIEAAVATAYLAVTSAEKRSGKSRLIEVLALLVARPLRAAGATEAALFRSLAKTPPPTLLLDEVDAMFGPKAVANNEDLRALLNAGYRRGTPVLRCAGERGQRVEELGVFGPKTLAGLGALPDTIADRSLQIRLKRRAPDEHVERFRERDASVAAEVLHAAAAAFAASHLEPLTAARPQLPDELDDRAQDACEPLVAIADCAGGCWPARARSALVALRGSEQAAEESSLGVRLLADVEAVFATKKATKLASEELLAALAALDEAPWGDFRGVGPLGARKLAQLLRPYGIRPADVRVGEKALKGYRLDELTDTFNRYLPTRRRRPQEARTRDTGDNRASIPDRAQSGSATQPLASPTETGRTRLNDADVARVAAPQPASAPCRYESHRGSDWMTPEGTTRCGICHPPTNGQWAGLQLAL